MAVFAPMPRASVRMAATANPGLRRKERRPYRTSRRRDSSTSCISEEMYCGTRWFRGPERAEAGAGLPFRGTAPPRRYNALTVSVVFLSRFFRISFLAVCLLPAWSQVITTIAGTDWLFPGDGVKATNAPIGGSFGLDVAAGPDGSFYIADLDSEMVMRAGTDGIIHVI